MTNDKEVIVKFYGIDSWNRPIFKGGENSFYGSTNILFSYGTPGADIVGKISESDLTYFGESFDCEPWGGKPVNKLKIFRPE